MDLINRFKYIMKLNNLTASAFANQIGVQPSSVSHILSGRNKPSLEFIQKILKAYPKVDSNWLINGTTSTSKKLSTPPPKEEEVSMANNKVESGTTKPELKQKAEGKSIAKVLIFYTDGTFEEFKSS